jgi:hypothetical protein
MDGCQSVITTSVGVASQSTANTFWLGGGGRGRGKINGRRMNVNPPPFKEKNRNFDFTGVSSGGTRTGVP